MSRACWMYRGVLASAVFTVRDHMMTSKIISIALAGACLLACSNAWSWCSGLMKPDTHLGENARHIEVSDDQTTPCFFR